MPVMLRYSPLSYFLAGNRKKKGRLTAYSVSTKNTNMAHKHMHTFSIHNIYIIAIGLRGECVESFQVSGEDLQRLGIVLNTGLPSFHPKIAAH